MAASNSIKGLTVEIGGDTTELGKALQDVDKKSKSLSSELSSVNKLLKLDPSDVNILAQKQEILAEAIENTRKKLDTLKEAETQVQAQFERGEASAAQVRELQREIAFTESALGKYEKAAEETADALDQLGKDADEASDDVSDVGDESSDAAKDVDKLGDAAQETADDLDGAGKAMGSFLGNLASDALQKSIDFLRDAVDASREYRTEMGKLDTAFTQSGFSSETATAAYKELVGVLGETDQSVEAANHLAKLTDNEQELATWTGDILPGVFATFGDSLPIEGLTEAANETAKVGQVTGPLADALNWAGVSEDAFNESLAECNSEQERQALITETLAGLYSEASESYKTLNADVIAANQANDAWAASLAGVGAEVEPLLTEIKTMGATLISDITPVISALLDNLPAIGVAITGITAAIAAFKIASIAATAATKGMTLAQYAAAAAQSVLNTVLNANPIGLIILGITALVTAFTLLWNNCEGFREFWINLWDGIKNAVSKAVEWVKENWQSMLLFLVNPLAGIFKYCYEHFDGFRESVDKIFAKVQEIFSKFVTTLKELPGKIWSAIVGAVDKVTTWGENLKSKAKTAASNMLNNVTSTLKELPGKIWSSIAGAIDKVATWGSDMASKAKTAASNVVSSVTSTLKDLPSKVLSIGSDLVTGLWNGITNKLTWLKNKISGFASSVLSSIKSFFGVNSPSKETAWIGDMLDQGLAEGLLDNMNDPVKAMQKVTTGVLGAADEVDGLALSREIQNSTTATVAAQIADSGIMGALDKILTAIERGQIITLDGEALVGATYERYDTKLGQRRALAARGALA